MAEVTLDHISKDFGEVQAVHDISLQVRDEEFLVLVGPSGSGKTTILRIIAGLEAQTAGHVSIGGRQVDDVPPKDRDIAMVFQNYALYPHMNVYDNMAFGLKLNKIPSSEIDQRVRATAETLGIAHLLKRRPRELSGGQKQRVALGRAIIRHPKVFLMDEPLSNLDAKLRVQTRIELQKLQRELKTTTIYVTHDQIEAMTMGDRIAVLRDGRLMQVDTPEALYAAPANMFVASFIGSPAMNFIEGRLVAQGDDLWFADGGMFNLPLPASLNRSLRSTQETLPERVVLGVRPEDLSSDQAFQAAHPEWMVRCRVEVAEPMGSEVYLYLAAGARSLVARAGPQVRVRDGQEWTVALDLEKAHIFDPATERNISLRC